MDGHREGREEGSRQALICRGGTDMSLPPLHKCAVAVGRSRSSPYADFVRFCEAFLWGTRARAALSRVGSLI